MPLTIWRRCMQKGNSRRKKAKLAELLKSTGNGAPRRGGREEKEKEIPAGGTEMSATRSAMNAEKEVSADGVASCTQDQAPTQEQAMQVPVPEVDSSIKEEVPAVDVPSCSAGSVDGTAASYTLLHIPRSPEMQMAPPGKQGRQVSPPKERQEEEASELACEDPARVNAEVIKGKHTIPYPENQNFQILVFGQFTPQIEKWRARE